MLADTLGQPPALCWRHSRNHAERRKIVNHTTQWREVVTTTTHTPYQKSAHSYCTYQYTLCGMCIVGATLYYQYDTHHCIVWSVPPYVCYMYVTHVPRYMA